MRRGSRSSKDDAWRELAGRVKGTVQTDRRGRVKRIDFGLEPWIIVLDTRTESTGESSQTLTRWRSLYLATDDFRFRIYRRSLFSGIAKMFGMQDIEVGQPAIDEDWIIKSNSIGRIQSLMALPEIARSLASLRSGRLDVRPMRGRNRPPDHMVLTYETSGVVRDLPRLETGVTLMRHVLERMARLGSAARESPSTAL